MNMLSKIAQSDSISTVFTITDIQILLGISKKKAIYNAINYAVKNHQIYKISKGIFSFTSTYSKLEFANKYRNPSYISLYTVLQQNGVVFQPYQAIYAISKRSETIEIDGQVYIYRKIKNDILLNRLGINLQKNVYIATTERAICDKIYLDKDEYFDNLRKLDWDFISKINRDVYQNNKNISRFITKYTQ